MRAAERSPRPGWLVENVPYPEHDPHRMGQAPERRKRPRELTVDPQGTLVDDHDVGVEPERRPTDDRAPHPLHLVCQGREEARLVTVRRDSIEAGELEVVDRLGDAERVDDGRPGDDEDRRAREGTAERVGEEKRAVDVAQAEGVVGVEEDLRPERFSRRPGVRKCGHESGDL